MRSYLMQFKRDISVENGLMFHLKWKLSWEIDIGEHSGDEDLTQSSSARKGQQVRLVYVPSSYFCKPISMAARRLEGHKVSHLHLGQTGTLLYQMIGGG